VRLLAILPDLVVVAVIGLLCYLLVSAFTDQSRRQDAGARWRLRHYGERAETVVAVSLMPPDGRVLDEHVVDRIRDDDPEWSRRFLRAKEEAEERAFHLNADRDELPPG
jgi:pyridoxamine 5'-phosphate oxidase family protein